MTVPVPVVLVVQACPRQREAWRAALVAAGMPVHACTTAAEATLVIATAPVLAVVVETPIATAEAGLMAAAPTGQVPPFVLVGDHHRQSTAAPRIPAAARLGVGATPAAVVEAVRTLVAALPPYRVRRRAFHLRVPATRVVKWTTWVTADDVTAPA
ncbi:MAG: hypothetical protein K8W52_31765 [Deltaproteobacteria bacterium]|nr:hypothetical protein [Deltaproteobacteria bacterium]